MRLPKLSTPVKRNLPPARNSFLMKPLQGETFLDRENLLHDYKYMATQLSLPNG